MDRRHEYWRLREGGGWLVGVRYETINLGQASKTVLIGDKLHVVAIFIENC